MRLCLLLLPLLLSAFPAGAEQARWPCMLTEKARAAAIRQWNESGVELTVSNPSAFARNEPVTSGLPLPEGCVKDVSTLCLYAVPSPGEGLAPALLRANTTGQGSAPSGQTSSNQRPAIPCQFTVQSRWPDQSAKWILLDFIASVGASNSVKYVLKEGKPAAGEKRVKVEQKDSGVIVDAGRLLFLVATNAPGLVHNIRVDSRQALTEPIQVTLMDASNRLFRAACPNAVVTEQNGPLRATVLVKGEFMDAAGQKLLGGKIQYECRITAYVGKPYVYLALSVANFGNYGFRNEYKPRQWLYFKSLALNIPAGSDPRLAVKDEKGIVEISDGGLAAQWFKYPKLNARSQREVVSEQERAAWKALWPTVFDEPWKGFYSAIGSGTNKAFRLGRLSGCANIAARGKHSLSIGVRHFSENFPAGFAVGKGEVSFLMFPSGGFWPRTKQAMEEGTYCLEGGRQKTSELLLSFGDEDKGAHLEEMANHPLFVLADPAWYRDTGAILPMGGGKPGGGDKELVEAWQRYDRMQRAKVNVASGDPAIDLASTNSPFSRELGKVSIPSLWEAAPDVFMGSFNHGDLVWAFGYCSVFYCWPYTMLENYLRLGDREFLDVGTTMIRHRIDMDQYRVADAPVYIAHLQRYEKGEHGNLERHDFRTKSWELNPAPSHTWNRDLLLYWAMTGSAQALEAAEQNGRAYERLFTGDKKWTQTNAWEYGEFRTPGWAMENWLALYEYTGKTNWLGLAEKMFDRTLLAMEQKNGGKGHIIKDGKQSSQFLSMITEPVCRLHHYTGRKDVVEFLGRVLEWQRKELSGGGEVRDGKVYPTVWQTGEWEDEPENAGFEASGVYSIALLDGYAYCSRVLGDKKNMDLARKLFKESVFYPGVTNGSPRETRTPLGYHLQGTPIGAQVAKQHAWSGRYGQLYMMIDGMEE